jgi:peptidoglycan hydrolase-like protein with peptidoglycan-binding domain
MERVTMHMSISPLVDYTRLSPNRTTPRKDAIRKITIHHMAGGLTVESCGELFAQAARQASANYGIGSDGRVGQYVDERDRAWTSSSPANDNQAVTIEVANDGGAPDWHVSDAALAKTIDLCLDICKRNGIPRLDFTGDASGNLTQHCYFAATACPGPYLKSKFVYIADAVNRRLQEYSVAQTDSRGNAQGEELELDGQQQAGELGLANQAQTEMPSPQEPQGEKPRPVSHPTLCRGDAGENVSDLQARLNTALQADSFPTLDVDGEFGRLTETAVKAYQFGSGLAADGICGPATWAELTRQRVMPAGLQIMGRAKVAAVDIAAFLSRACEDLPHKSERGK